MTCELCTRPTPNFACDDCGDQYANDLKALVEWLDEDLETSVGGAKGVQYRAGRTSGGGEAGLRVNWRAAALYRRLHLALSLTVDHCIDTSTRHSSPTNTPPARTVSAMALWLTWRVDGLTLDKAGPEHIKALTRLADQARDLVFWVPPERRFLGSCELCGEGYVYAEGDDEQATCNRCESAFPAEVRRAQLMAQLDDRLMDAAEIAQASTYLGLRDDRGRVHDCIRQWARRDRITSRSGEGEKARYRFGDVYPLLLERERRVG